MKCQQCGDSGYDEDSKSGALCPKGCKPKAPAGYAARMDLVARMGQSYPRGMAKRGYSREFTPRSERRVKFEIDRVPPTLADRVRAKLKREGVSLRALVLQMLTDWVDREEPKRDV